MTTATATWRNVTSEEFFAKTSGKSKKKGGRTIAPEHLEIAARLVANLEAKRGDRMEFDCDPLDPNLRANSKNNAGYALKNQHPKVAKKYKVKSETSRDGLSFFLWLVEK